MVTTVNKPWGREELLYQGNGYAVKRISLNNNQKTSLHFHEIKHETILMLSGTLRVEIRVENLDEVIVLLRKGEHLCIDPKVIHRMQSIDGDSIYFEAQTDHLDDVIRLSDDFGRV